MAFGLLSGSEPGKGNQNSLGVPHVLSSLNLLPGSFFGERRFDIGHGWNMW
jgi:hypothetical protein